MRAGVRFDGARYNAVIVDEQGVVVTECEQSSDPARGVAEVLGWIARNGGDEVRSVTFDVSTLLRAGHQSPVVAIRISPRPAADEIHAIAVSPELADAVRGTVHVTGGHDMRARELCELGLAELRRELQTIATAGGELVASVAAVGSVASADHEQRAADEILAAWPDARISLSHEFFSTALRDRDFTAAANASLLESGECLATDIERVAAELLPAAALAFGLNDGGRAPLRRLGATPVHALRAPAGLRVQAARHLAGVDDGDLVILADESVVVGHVQGGVPTTHNVVKRGSEPSLASNTARVDGAPAPTFSDLPTPAAVVDVRTGTAPPPPGTPTPTVRSAVDLIALGAAVAPLSSWSDSLKHASNAAELQSELRSSEEDLRSQTIHWGAPPDRTRVVESNAYTLVYGSHHVVRIRVRVIGDWVDTAAVAQEGAA